MELTKTELKMLIKEFLVASNRVLRAGVETYDEELSKFVKFLENHEIIYEYIKSCGEPEYDVKKEVEEVSSSYGRKIFTLGSSDEGEVANIYAVIKYIAENNYHGRSYIYSGYSRSKNYQEKVNGFGNGFIRILVSHIEMYLTKLSIEMGMDEQMTVSLNIQDSTLENTQLNVASVGASMVTNKYSFDEKELQSLIDTLRAATEALNDEDKQNVNDCIETIETLRDENPKKGLIRMATATLKKITGTAEFMAAALALIQFVKSVIPIN